MKALQQIIKCVAENPSQPWALATLVQTEGSTYRKPGARLLVDSDGGTLGVLSGGCLRGENARPREKVSAAASPLLLAFVFKMFYGCAWPLENFVETPPSC